MLSSNIQLRILMRRLLTLFAKNLPFITKKVAFFTVLYTQHKLLTSPRSLLCASTPQTLKQNIENIEQKSIKIYSNGQLVGYAYCFAHNYLVSVCEQLLHKGHNNKTFEYYLGGEKLKGSFKVVGNFENLVFLQFTLSDRISSISADFAKPISYSQVQIMKQRQFMSIKHGFFITQDSGYGIVDGEGEVGSIVTNGSGIAGIVVQVGSQSLKGFLRIIQWRHLLPILMHIKGKPLHLGISAQAIQNQEGVSVVRIAPNSPFKHDIMMGDLIIRANGHRFRDPESLHRICMESNGDIQLLIQRQGKHIQVKIHL